jgi:hypothetical protein
MRGRVAYLRHAVSMLRDGMPQGVNSPGTWAASGSTSVTFQATREGRGLYIERVEQRGWRTPHWLREFLAGDGCLRSRVIRSSGAHRYYSIDKDNDNDKGTMARVRR